MMVLPDSLPCRGVSAPAGSSRSSRRRNSRRADGLLSGATASSRSNEIASAALAGALPNNPGREAGTNSLLRIMVSSAGGIRGRPLEGFEVVQHRLDLHDVGK